MYYVKRAKSNQTAKQKIVNGYRLLGLLLLFLELPALGEVNAVARDLRNNNTKGYVDNRVVIHTNSFYECRVNVYLALGFFTIVLSSRLVFVFTTTRIEDERLRCLLI